MKDKKELGTLIRSNGDYARITPADGREFTLEELQKAVGGYIEVILLPAGRKMFVNEDARVISMRPRYNEGASMMVGYEILGDVIVVGKS